MTWREHQRSTGREYWTRLLHQCGGNVSQAARVADVRRTEVYRIIHKLGLNHHVIRERHVGRWAQFGL